MGLNYNHDHNLNRYSGENHRDKLVDRYEEEKYNKRYPADRFTSDRHTFNIYDADRTPNRFSDASYGGDSDRAWGERNRYPSRRPSEGAMFFLKREQMEQMGANGKWEKMAAKGNQEDSVTHHSYGK